MSNIFSGKCLVLWDIVGSSSLSGKYGQPEAESIKGRCKNIVQSIMQRYSGNHANDTGDGTYIVFESHISAINFITVCLQYFVKFQAKNSKFPRLRFMSVSGPVIVQASGNIQGDLPTLAARLDGPTEAMCCTVAEGFYNDLIKIDKNFNKFFSSFDIEIKNVSDTKAFNFDWTEYAKLHGEDTLRGIISEHLKTAEVDLSSLSINLLDPGVVFWPVVPRNVLTAIHRAQIEVLKILDFIGWEVHIVIVNVCTTGENSQNEYSAFFYKKIQEYLSRRNVDFNHKLTKLSELFEVKSGTCCDARKLLEQNILRINFTTLKKMNDKRYASVDLVHSGSLPISRHLRPIYTITGLSFISEESNFKHNLILSGEDESIYWENMTAKEPHNSIVIPRLDGDHDTQVMQKNEYPIWKSKRAFTTALSESSQEEISSNLPTWIRNMFITLPSFVLDDYGAKAADVDKKYKKQIVPEGVLVDNVFQLLDLHD